MARNRRRGKRRNTPRNRRRGKRRNTRGRKYPATSLTHGRKAKITEFVRQLGLVFVDGEEIVVGHPFWIETLTDFMDDPEVEMHDIARWLKNHPWIYDLPAKIQAEIEAENIRKGLEHNSQMIIVVDDRYINDPTNSDEDADQETGSGLFANNFPSRFQENPPLLDIKTLHVNLRLTQSLVSSCQQYPTLRNCLIPLDMIIRSIQRELRRVLLLSNGVKDVGTMFDYDLDETVSDPIRTVEMDSAIDDDEVDAGDEFPPPIPNLFTVNRKL